MTKMIKNKAIIIKNIKQLFRNKEKINNITKSILKEITQFNF